MNIDEEEEEERDDEEEKEEEEVRSAAANTRIRRKIEIEISATDLETINKYLMLAKDNQFPTKEFEVESKVKNYVSYMHFFETEYVIPNQSEQHIFRCLFCNLRMTDYVGTFSNQKAHLNLLVDVKINSIVDN